MYALYSILMERSFNFITAKSQTFVQFFNFLSSNTIDLKMTPDALFVIQKLLPKKRKKKKLLPNFLILWLCRRWAS